ncbi:DoxX family protein [Brevibacterium casei]|nr:DoxX family protein [Brevibacterium casei]
MLVLSIITWALSGLLAALFLMAGLAKVRDPHNSTKPMPTLLDYTPGQVRWIGIVEVLGAIGIILPALLGILPGSPSSPHSGSPSSSSSRSSPTGSTTRHSP